ncbi:MAG: DNA methyltransferase [Prosthecobacter sp.]
MSPYIGKLKSSIANFLVERYSHKEDLILDPFCGAGTIPLEAALLGRRVVASDVSSYGVLLTRAKLKAPATLEAALNDIDALYTRLSEINSPDLRQVPLWVRRFFHPKTLKEAINFSSLAATAQHNFLGACLLGVLHHQRPGFLSFPSSHLVPYLRTKKFPKDEFPDLYKYREVRSRVAAKVNRAFRRPAQLEPQLQRKCEQIAIEKLKVSKPLDAIITSPPYMNALDYTRDNRLRLWMLNKHGLANEHPATRNLSSFTTTLRSLFSLAEAKLKQHGWCVLVIGEKCAGRVRNQLSPIVMDVAKSYAPSLKLGECFLDNIPDVRRSRRNIRGVKEELIMAFEKF